MVHYKRSAAGLHACRGSLCRTGREENKPCARATLTATSFEMHRIAPEIRPHQTRQPRQIVHAHAVLLQPRYHDGGAERMPRVWSESVTGICVDFYRRWQSPESRFHSILVLDLDGRLIDRVTSFVMPALASAFGLPADRAVA
jgi:hypothetical protein